MKYALITGASRGLGKAFAHELAKRSYNLILVALPEENLIELKNELLSNKIDVQIIETDMSQKQNVLQLCEHVNRHYDLEVLINNAGMGGTAKFIESDPDYINNIIQLNVMSLSLMTRQLLPNLMKRDKAYVLNVSSMAAFSPMGYKTVYPASKAFVHHFSRGLYQELKNTNVFVSVVNPGPMKTNEEVSKRIDKQGWMGKMGLLSPEKVAEISIKQLFKKDTLIMLGMGNGINWLLMKIIPIWIRLPLLTNAIKRELKPAS